ncbi:transcriptional regulator GcvA [Pollutimonas bauzanensis]|uniref:LysR family transcriptional regulator, glycine cleavage system transcriptional activator n=1 Tax=Pollutimonas bauzanensis TaxID=658167 RepID=A0A1M5XMK4_9BURK|nr:transcriptional regulator GcvA [Pollutimonas bauzanensis]SHI01085.1 LysR family transcriptional regulator, glycine cleavage system transcriptional activator [Pollutimonas bauzanensis]
MRRLPPLNALRAFDASARNASFTRAAQELCVTQGAVSRHVGALEDWLKIKLFERGRYGIELTAQGSAYFRTIKNALDQIEYGSQQLRQSPDENRLRIKLPPTFAIRWLVPRLARFHALHPGIDVQITTSHQRADFDREDVDVSIHSEARHPGASAASSRYLYLFGETLLPVCAPGLLKREPALSAPGDLAGHVLLCSMNRPLDWPTWLEAAGVGHIDGNSGLKFENAALAYQAATDQLGVMVAQLAFVNDDLASGRLVAPFGLRVATSGAYYLAYRADVPKPARVQLFEDWILAEADAMNRQFAGQGGVGATMAGLPASEATP